MGPPERVSRPSTRQSWSVDRTANCPARRRVWPRCSRSGEERSDAEEDGQGWRRALDSGAIAGQGAADLGEGARLRGRDLWRGRTRAPHGVLGGEALVREG